MAKSKSVEILKKRIDCIERSAIKEICDMECETCWCHVEPEDEQDALYDVVTTLERINNRTAKKPIQIDKWEEYYKCPVCGKYAVDNLGCKYKFCPNCGTEFDWK